MNQNIEPKTKNTQWIFLCTYLCIEIIIFLSNDMFLPAVQAIAKVFNLYKYQAQQAVSLWFIGSAIVQLISGSIDNYLGHKRTLMLGALLFALASALCAFTQNYFVFSIGRFFEGASVGLILTSGYSIIHSTNTSLKAIKILSLLQVFTILPAALGPTLGAIFIKYLNWQYMFVAFFVLSALTILFFQVYTPYYEQITTDKLDLKKTFSAYAKMIKNKTMMLYITSSTFILMLLIFWIVESIRIIINAAEQSIMSYAVMQFCIAMLLSVGGCMASRIASSINLKYAIIKILSIQFVSLVLGSVIMSLYNIPIQAAAFLVAICFFCSGSITGTLNRLAIESSTENMAMSNSFVIAVRSAGAALSCVIAGTLTTINMQIFFYIAAFYSLGALVVFMLSAEVRLHDKK